MSGTMTTGPTGTLANELPVVSGPSRPGGKLLAESAAAGTVCGEAFRTHNLLVGVFDVNVMAEEEEQSPATEEAASTQQVTNGVGSMHFHYDVYLLDFVGLLDLLDCWMLDFEEAASTQQVI